MCPFCKSCGEGLLPEETKSEICDQCEETGRDVIISEDEIVRKKIWYQQVFKKTETTPVALRFDRKTWEKITSKYKYAKPISKNSVKFWDEDEQVWKVANISNFPRKIIRVQDKQNN